VIHNYRWRIGLAESEPEYAGLEERLAVGPVITVPTITLEGDANGAPHPEPSAYAAKFSGRHSHRTIEGGIETTFRRKPLWRLPTLSPRSVADADGCASVASTKPSIQGLDE